MNAKAKTINLLLYDGDLDGVISIEDSNWNAGELYSAPRESVSELLKTDACNKYGVYLLLSSSKVYVGQSSDLAKRLTQHTIGKDWWESAVILTTNNDSLTHSDIDYLENVLIEKAFELERLDCDNRKKGNPPKVDKFRKVYLGQYLEEALFVMQLIGINVFAEDKSGKRAKTAVSARAKINTIDVHTKLAIGKRAKAEAVGFLQEKGITLNKTICYAVLQDGKKTCWANPNVSCLQEDWSIILNDTSSMTLLLLNIPANSLVLSNGVQPGLKTRNDIKYRIEMNIAVDSLIEKTSGIDLSNYLVEKIQY